MHPGGRRCALPSPPTPPSFLCRDSPHSIETIEKNFSNVVIDISSLCCSLISFLFAFKASRNTQENTPNVNDSATKPVCLALVISFFVLEQDLYAALPKRVRAKERLTLHLPHMRTLYWELDRLLANVTSFPCLPACLLPAFGCVARGANFPFGKRY